MENKKKWWLAGGVTIATLLIVAVLGSTTDYFGAFRTTRNVDLTLNNDDVVDLSASKPTRNTSPIGQDGADRQPNNSIRQNDELISPLSSDINSFQISDTGLDENNNLFAEVCFTQTPELPFIFVAFYLDGELFSLKGGNVSSATCYTETSSYDIFNNGANYEFTQNYGDPTPGQTYELSIRAFENEGGLNFSTEIIPTLEGLRTIYTTDITVPELFTIENLGIDDTYENFTANICNENGSTASTASFTVNSHTENVSFSMPAEGSCTEISISTSAFGELIPLRDYTLTVEADYQSATSTFRLIPDVEVTSVSVSGNDVDVEVCAVGTGDLGNLNLVVRNKIDVSNTIMLPSTNTCKTVSYSLTDAEMAQVESGDILEVTAEIPKGYLEESDTTNNQGTYTF